MKIRDIRVFEPMQEIRHQYYANCDRKSAIRHLSEQYVNEHEIKCETIEQNKKILIDTDTDTCINVYSSCNMSKEAIYAIAASYKHISQFTRNLKEFLQYLKKFYGKEIEELEDIENRTHLCEYLNNDIVIAVDVEPESLGFDKKVINWTRYFNLRKDLKYHTAIKAYEDFEILVISDKKIEINTAIAIARAHRKAQSCIWDTEESAMPEELYESGLKREVNIKRYEYNYNFLEIEIK